MVDDTPVGDQIYVGRFADENEVNRVDDATGRKTAVEVQYIILKESLLTQQRRPIMCVSRLVRGRIISVP